MKDPGGGWRFVRLFGEIYALSAVPLLVLILAGLIHVFSPDFHSAFNPPPTVTASLPFMLLIATLISLVTSVWMKRGGLLQVARSQGPRGSRAGNLAALILMQLMVTGLPCFLAVVVSAFVESAWILEAAFVYAIVASIVFKPDIDGIYLALAEAQAAPEHSAMG